MSYFTSPLGRWLQKHVEWRCVQEAHARKHPAHVVERVADENDQLYGRLSPSDLKKAREILSWLNG